MATSHLEGAAQQIALRSGQKSKLFDGPQVVKLMLGCNIGRRDKDVLYVWHTARIFLDEVAV